MVFIGWNSTWLFNRIQLVDGDMKYPQRIDVGIVMAFLKFKWCVLHCKNNYLCTS